MEHPTPAKIVLPSEAVPIPVSFEDEDLNAILPPLVLAMRRDAERLHARYKNGSDLSEEELKRMSSGLSSIVDLIDCSENGQKTLIDDSMWSVLTKKFEGSKHFHSKPLNQEVKNCWKLISRFANRTNSLDKSKKYLSNIVDCTSDRYQLKIYNIFEFILNLYEENSFLFEQKNASQITELDYISIVWAPLFRKIIHLNNNMIRLKTGNTTNPTSDFGKDLLYDSDNNTSMKVDLRFIVDINKKEVDVGAGEVAAEVCSIEKFIRDEGKLVREGKDVLDGLMDACINYSIHDLVGMIIQIAGLSGEISSVRMINPKVYLATPHQNVNIPHSMLELEPFLNTLENLIGMVEKMEEMAALAIKTGLFFKEQRHSIGDHYGRRYVVHLKDQNNYLAWVGRTYYFPSHHDYSKSIIPKIESIREHDVDGSKMIVQEEKDNEYDQSNVDEYGFVSVPNGKFYNTIIKQYYDQHPLSN